MFKKKSIYFDYSGATPIDHNVLNKMSLYKKDFFANPSAIYKDGVNIKNIIEESRNKIAKSMNVHSDEIIFTSSGTESDALAILGVVKEWNIKNKNILPHIITTKIEHPAILENCKFLEENKEIEVTYLSVDKEGIVDIEELKNSLKVNTILVSIMYANNEIGSIQPLQEIAKIIRHFRKGKMVARGQTSGSLEVRPLSTIFPLFHTDAAQAMNYLYTENIEKLGVDMMSFNSSKIYGPKGIGILYKKRGINIVPLYFGGGQEFGIHPGTESIELIVGITEALIITNKIKQKESERLIKIRDYGIEKLIALSKTSEHKIVLNGGTTKRLPNNINISILGISSELLVIELSSRGIFVSEKSACHSKDDNSSYVIKSIRKICKRNNEEEGSLRISLGRQTTKKDIDILVKELSKVLDKYKKLKIH